MSTAAHILVVDDDPGICDLLGVYLTKAGFRVSSAGDGKAMRQVLAREPADLIILDLNLPGEDGFSLVTYLRNTSTARIIVLTGSTENVDEVVGLELGADDYVSKPCDLRHLLARIRASLRRAEENSDKREVPDSRSIVRFGDWSFNLPARQLISPENEEVPLTAAEFDLLVALTTHPNRVLSRNQLFELIHGREWSPYDRSIDNLITRLRRKLRDDPKHPRLIKTVRSVGYVFTVATTDH